MSVEPEVLLKTIASPKRMSILYELAFQGGSARVSDLAKALGEAPNSVSYHVRELAKAGIVEKAESPTTDARETWYQIAGSGLYIDAETQTNKLDIGAILERVYESRSSSPVIARHRAKAANSPGGSDVVYGFLNVLRLTAEEKDELTEAIQEALDRAQAQDRKNKARLEDPKTRESALEETERFYIDVNHFPVIEDTEDRATTPHE
ncbi:MAG: winged helix-turn-helix domain-containing protein [Actinomycetaceae bacterium]|nr:winged helix-turn-helix domain-containing protein [Actinomycetaceae bacterium]